MVRARVCARRTASQRAFHLPACLDMAPGRAAAAWSLTALLGIDKCCAPASLTVFAQQLEVSRNPAHVWMEPQATG